MVVSCLPSVSREEWQEKGPRNVVSTCWMVRIMTNVVIIGEGSTVIHVTLHLLM